MTRHVDPGRKSPRVIKPKAPEPSERQMQRAILDYIAASHPSAHVHAIPNGGRRDMAEAAQLHLDGVRAGVPDLCVLWPGGGVCWLEVKSRTGTIQPTQRAYHAMLGRLGHRVAVVRSVDEAAEVLSAWSVPTRRSAA